MPTFAMSKEQTIKTIAENLTRAGALNSDDAPRFVATLKEYDQVSIIKTLIHSHEIKEVRLAFEESQKPQKKRGRLMAKLTGMLRPAHVARGYHLMEDEDYLYLYLPDDSMPPIVFNATTTTLEQVIETICRLESEDA